MFNTSIFIFSSLLCILCILIRTTQTQKQDHRSESDSGKIHLYHFPNPFNTSERHEFRDSGQTAKLEKDKRIKIVVHGAGSHCLKDDVPFRAIKAYLRAKQKGRGDYNILCLDYGDLALTGPVPGDPIPSVRKRYEYVCDIVSEKAVRLILALEENGYASSFNSIHIVGHSLGGQVSGYIGRKIQEKTGKIIGRITGLDIANIFLIYSNEVNLRNQLDLSDAKFVDIIHTSPIGLKGDYGHVDFYPDGGLHQRSCLTKGPVSNVSEIIIGGCSHVVVGKYWETSIDVPNITACKRDSWESFQKRKAEGCQPENTITFGEYVPTIARGKYFLEYPLIDP